METVKWLGLKQLDEAMRIKIPAAFGWEVMQRCLKEASRPIIADAIQRAPKRSGSLRDHIWSFPDRKGSTNHFFSRLINVKTRSGSKTVKKFGITTHESYDDPFYWIWIEFGHAQIFAKQFGVLGTTTTGFFGKSVRAYAPHPFLRPAFTAKARTAVETFRQQMLLELDSVINYIKWNTPTS